MNGNKDGLTNPYQLIPLGFQTLSDFDSERQQCLAYHGLHGGLLLHNITYSYAHP